MSLKSKANKRKSFHTMQTIIKKSLMISILLCPLSGSALAYNSQTFFHDLKTKNIKSSNRIVWQQFGPGMSGNNKLAFWHATDPKTLYISPNMGNSYVSNDGGLSYRTVLNADATKINLGTRGPRAFSSMDFSRTHEKFGYATDLKHRGLLKTTDKGNTWQRENHNFGKAYLSKITVDSKNDNIWYLGAGRMNYTAKILFPQNAPHGVFTDKNSQGKIWKTTNKGKTWTLINKGLNPKSEVQNIIVDPNNSQILYLSSNYGFYKSTNGGKSWLQKHKGLNSDVIRSLSLGYDKKSHKKILYLIASLTWKKSGRSIADDKGGIFASSDLGESWHKINGDLALDMRQFKHNKRVLQSYYHTLGYYFSISDQQARKQFPQMPAHITQRFTQVSVDPNDYKNIYLINMYSNASRNNFMPGAIWRSKNMGQHWYITFRNGKNWNHGADISYWKKRNNPTGTNISLKYLHEWINRDTYERKSCNFAKFNANGKILHVQMDKISLMSYDKGETWVDIDDTLTSTPNSYIGGGNSNVPGHGFYQDKRFPHKLYALSGENALWITNDDTSKIRPHSQSATYHRLLNAETSLSSYAIDPKDPKIRYALFFRQKGRGKFMKSTDSGKTFHIQGKAIPYWKILAHHGDQSVHQLSLIIDPKNRQNMYFVVPKHAQIDQYVGNSQNSFGVHKSSDGGKTWHYANNGLPKSRDATSITFDPQNPHILYATIQGYKGGLYKSSDQARSWQQVATSKRISAKTGINSIFFAQDHKIYITAGYISEQPNHGGLWVSDNHMKSWKKIFDYPWVNKVKVALYDPKVILISTLANKHVGYRNAGTYLSKDSGKTWLKINKDNGQSDRINDIAIDQTIPNKFYISTYGSGFYVGKPPLK